MLPVKPVEEPLCIKSMYCVYLIVIVVIHRISKTLYLIGGGGGDLVLY